MAKSLKSLNTVAWNGGSYFAGAGAVALGGESIGGVIFVGVVVMGIGVISGAAKRKQRRCM